MGKSNIDTQVRTNGVRADRKLLCVVMGAALLTPGLPAWAEDEVPPPDNLMKNNSTTAQTDGGFQTGVAIQVPRFRDLEPQLRLSYSSGREKVNGWLGYGFSLAGLSVIERASPGLGRPNYDDTDVFVLDGEELIPYTALGGQYATKIQSYVRIRRHHPEPNQWMVESPDGIRRIYAPVISVEGVPQRWALVRVEKQVNDVTIHQVEYVYKNLDGPDGDAYLESILYNSNRIRFYYEPRPDEMISAIGATTLLRTAHRLAAIEVRGPLGLVRAYDLSYLSPLDASSKLQLNGRSLLASVQMLGQGAQVTSDGVVQGVPQVPAVRMNWELPPLTLVDDGFKEANTPSGRWGFYDRSGTGVDAIYFKDLRGKGSGRLRVLGPKSLSLQSTVAPPLGDFDGDGDLDSAAFPPEKTEADDWHGCDTLFGDIDGDGLTDRLDQWKASFYSSKCEGDVFYHRSNGEKMKLQWRFSKGMRLNDGYRTAAALVDLSGDGRAELLTIKLKDGGSRIRVYDFQEKDSRIWGSKIGHPNFGFGMSFADVNGDGLADLITSYKSKFWVQLSTGNDLVPFGPGVFESNYEAQPSRGKAWPRMVFADMNGDGLADMLYVRKKTREVRVRLSTGVGFAEEQVWAELPRSIWSRGFGVGDLTGDGKPDFAFYAYDNGPDGWVVMGSRGPRAYRVKSVENGYGKKTVVEYAPSSRWRTVSDSSQGVPMRGVMSTVKRLIVDDGLNETPPEVTEFEYEGARYDVARRKFLGFRRVTEKRLCGEVVCKKAVSTFRQDYASVGKPERVDQLGPEDKLLVRSEYVYSINETDGVFISVLDTETQTEFDGSLERKRVVEHTYDNFGNQTQTFDHGAQGQDDGILTVSEFLYPRGADAPYLAALEIRESIFGPEQEKLFETVIERDAWGNPRASKVLALDDLPDGTSTETWRVTRFEYNDAHGNLTDIIDPMLERTVRVYDTLFNQFVVRETNPAGHIVETKWHPGCQAPVFQTIPSLTTGRVDAVTRYDYDDLCRVVRVTSPLGTEASTSYCDMNPAGINPCGQATKQHVRTEKSGPGSQPVWKKDYFDGQHRTWQSERPASDGRTIVSRVGYDARGLRAFQVAPHFDGEPERRVDTEYDWLNRPTRVWLPGPFGDRPQRSIEYGLRRIAAASEVDPSLKGIPLAYRATMDELGHKVEELKNMRDQVVLVRHPGIRKREMFYDARGHLKKLRQDGGVQFHYQYDSSKNLIREEDPNRGYVNYGYDALGRKTLQEQGPLGGAPIRRVEWFLDGLGRIVKKEAKRRVSGAKPWSLESDAVLVYDEPSAVPGAYNVGQLTSVQDSAGTLNLSFNAEGAEIYRLRRMDGQDYVFRTHYDGQGRVQRRSYPEPLGDVEYGYHDSGEIAEISGLVRNVKTFADGRIQRFEGENGTVTQRTLHADYDWIASQTVEGPDTSIQSVQYTYNRAGLITEIRSAMPGHSWAYEYDAGKRLTAAHGLGESSRSEVFQYDARDNIIATSKEGCFSYGSAFPHAVTRVGTKKYSYDALGNMKNRNGLALGYDADNRLVQIGTRRVVYDSAGERRIVLSPDKTVLYLDYGYEVEKSAEAEHDRTQIYVRLKGELVAKRVRENRVVSSKRVLYGDKGKRVNEWAVRTDPYWIHTNHLGSVRAVTDASGQVASMATYRPYGEAKTKNVPSELWETKEESRNFIGESQDESGLLYLHARYYDPQLGRFISPDPSHPLGAGVGLNPYAYSGNDPVNNIDRNGLFFFNKNKEDSSENKSDEPGLSGIHREIGELAQNSYHAGAARKNWERVQDFVDPDSGFAATLFKRQKGNLYVLAFRGTEGLVDPDAVTDVAQGLGLPSEQYDLAIKLAAMAGALAERQGATLRLTGHSLGGGLATAAGLVNGQHSVVFNPAGVHRNTLSRYDASFDRAGELVTNYIVAGEILNTAQDFMPLLRDSLPSSVGRRIYLERGARPAVSFSGHGSDAYLNSPGTVIK